MLAFAVWLGVFSSSRFEARGESLADVIETVQPAIVKIYGAGGFRGLEAYQSGFLVSAEGHILTVWSYVLDSDSIVVMLNDGRKFEAQLVAADPRMEIALLKLDGTGLPHVRLAEAPVAEAGTRVLAFSNLFNVATGDEPASVQHGVISAYGPLHARRGVYESPYKGSVYLLDAMTNNPGAAGGLLTDDRGRPLGLLGKELRNAQNNTWLNFALPVGELASTVDEMIAGRYVRRSANEPINKPHEAWSLDRLGLAIVPDVLFRTPPYVDAIRPGSPAAIAGLRPDDLIVFVNERLISSTAGLRSELEWIDRIDPVRVSVLRDQELLELTLRPQENAQP